MLKRYFLILCVAFYATTAQAFSPWDLGGNPSSDKLVLMSENGQAEKLSQAMSNICTGTDPYYMGTEHYGVNKGVAFWSITCKENSKAKFLIIIAPDAVGSTKVIQCNLLHGQPFTCYKKIVQ